jgi:hypothetical protein
MSKVYIIGAGEDHDGWWVYAVAKTLKRAIEIAEQCVAEREQERIETHEYWKARGEEDSLTPWAKVEQEYQSPHNLHEWRSEFKWVSISEEELF